MRGAAENYISLRGHDRRPRSPEATADAASNCKQSLREPQSLITFETKFHNESLATTTHYTRFGEGIRMLRNGRLATCSVVLLQ